MKIENQEHKNDAEKGSVAPYLLGWLLGVPGSVLLLIFVLRSCA